MQSQMLDVAIALVTVFFLVAVISSAIVEMVSNLMSKRARDLDHVLTGLLKDPTAFKATAVYRALSPNIDGRTKRTKGPSYVPARSFADAAIEATLTSQSAGRSARDVIASMAPSPLKDRLTILEMETGGDLTKVKAGLESWFDASMASMQTEYKRWSSWALLIVGFVIALTCNVSATRIADTLWTDAPLRSALVNSAPQIVQGPCPQQVADCSPQQKVTAVFGELKDLHIPLGWGSDWAHETGAVWTVLGWLPIAFAAKAGAPFWFGLVVRLTGLRSGRGAPASAAEDGSSHTTAAANGTSTGTLDSVLQGFVPARGGTPPA